MTSTARDQGLYLLVYFLGCICSALAQTGYVYRLDTEYAGANFFQGWNFYTGGDPTGGYVTYYSQASAQQAGLINSSATAPAYIGVDYQTVTNVNGAGRPSVRISTQKSWTHGLFVGDFNHAPGGICGTWPAWWTLGSNWPYNGEIDILEGVNQLTQNAMSLHSNVNCSIAGDPSTETGTVQGTDCAYYVQYGGNGQGCGVQDSRTTSYGTGFNAIGGGVYAMQWTSDYIRVWFFQRNQIPQDITNLTPNPANWGLPAANLQGSCNIDQRFQSHEIIFDNTFCGSYAGVASVWNSSTNSCLLQTGYPTCNAFVAAQPAAFQNAYWSVNSVRVYQLQAAGASASSSATPYIASLQPNTSSASAASSVAMTIPTASLCPTYNFTVVQEGSFQYEIECGYNPPGSDLGPPHTNYVVHSFEDCIGGCTYWNTYNGSYVCGGVAYVVSNSACYWKKSISSAAAAPGYNGARLIYYGYPQVTDNPNVAPTITSTSIFVSTSVAAQYYVNPNVTQSSRALSSALATVTGGGVGAGFSIAASTSSTITSFSISSSTVVSTSTSTITSDSAQTSTALTPSATSSASASGPSSSPSSSSSAASTTSNAVITTSSNISTSTIATNLIFTSNTASLIFTSPSLTILSPLHISTSSSTSSLRLSSTSTIQSSPSSSSGSTYAPAPTPQQNTIATSLLSSYSVISSLSSLAPSFTPVTGDNPQNIAQFRYGGCQGSSNNFAGFRQVESEPTMSIKICVSDCYNSAFAGVFGGTCYCAENPSVANYFVTYPDADCDTPCPGMFSESCGGTIAAVTEHRGQAVIAFTIYNNTNLVAGSGAISSSSSSIMLSSTLSGSVLVGPVGTLGEGQSSSPSDSPATSLSVPPAVSTSQPFASTSETPLSSGTVILGPVGGSPSSARTSTTLLPSSTPASNSIMLQPTAITTIYVDVCDICEHGMTTVTTVITMMHCGCTESIDVTGSTVPVPPPIVPMTTTVKTCNCGEENTPSTTEVTIPCASQIEELSSSMESMLASATPGAATPAETTAAAVTGQISGSTLAASGENAPDTSATDRELLSIDENESESTPTKAAGAAANSASSSDVPEMTHSLASEAGILAGNNETSYATTKTIHLQSTETSKATTPNNVSMLVSAPQLGHPSTTTKGEESAAVERLASFMFVGLFCVTVVMSLL